MRANAIGVICATMKFAIHWAELVIAVALPRCRLPNISTGTAHASGPTAAENAKLKSHVIATNARLAAGFVVPNAPVSAAMTTRAAPESANETMIGRRRPSRSTKNMQRSSATTASAELPDWSASVVDVSKPMLCGVQWGCRRMKAKGLRGKHGRAVVADDGDAGHLQAELERAAEDDAAEERWRRKQLDVRRGALRALGLDLREHLLVLRAHERVAHVTAGVQARKHGQRGVRLALQRKVPGRLGQEQHEKGQRDGSWEGE
jgi:hypothetical protein